MSALPPRTYHGWWNFESGYLVVSTLHRMLLCSLLRVHLLTTFCAVIPTP